MTDKLPSWVNRTDDEMWEGLIHFGEYVAKVLALGIITAVCAASIWKNYRATMPERDAIRECLESNGKVRVFRDAKGKVFSVGCSHPVEWKL